MISIFVWNEDKKACEWLYYDFMEEGKGGKQDHWFVRMVWLYIFGKGELGGIEAVGTNTIRSIRDVIHGKKVHWYEQKKLMIMLIPINFLKLSPKCKCFLLLEMLRSSVRKDWSQRCGAHSPHMKIRIQRYI